MDEQARKMEQARGRTPKQSRKAPTHVDTLRDDDTAKEKP